MISLSSEDQRRVGTLPAERPATKIIQYKCLAKETMGGSVHGAAGGAGREFEESMRAKASLIKRTPNDSSFVVPSAQNKAPRIVRDLPGHSSQSSFMSMGGGAFSSNLVKN
jgi:hypothetical protein